MAIPAVVWEVKQDKIEEREDIDIIKKLRTCLKGAKALRRLFRKERRLEAKGKKSPKLDKLERMWLIYLHRTLPVIMREVNDLIRREKIDVRK